MQLDNDGMFQEFAVFRKESMETFGKVCSGGAGIRKENHGRSLVTEKEFGIKVVHGQKDYKRKH